MATAGRLRMTARQVVCRAICLLQRRVRSGGLRRVVFTNRPSLIDEEVSRPAKRTERISLNRVSNARSLAVARKCENITRFFWRYRSAKDVIEKIRAACAIPRTASEQRKRSFKSQIVALNLIGHGRRSHLFQSLDRTRFIARHARSNQRRNCNSTQKQDDSDYDQ